MAIMGSKAASGAYQAIISLMPPHETYIETHLGSGSIFLKKPPSIHNIGLDINPESVDQVKEKLKQMPYSGKARIENMDSHQFLKTYSFKGNELIYCDPPYLQSTRTSKNKYKHDYSEQQHIELLDLLTNIDTKIILSGYHSSLYEKHLSTWNTIEFQVMSRGGVRTEKLWFNFEPNSSYWASYAGNNFTQRQQIKRKAHRWASKYKEMPHGEQRAILCALLKVSQQNGSQNPLF